MLISRLFGFKFCSWTWYFTFKGAHSMVWQYWTHRTFCQYYFSSSDLTYWGGLSFVCDHVSTQQLAAWLVAWAPSADLELARIAGNAGQACFRAFRHTSEKSLCCMCGWRLPHSSPAKQTHKHALRKINIRCARSTGRHGPWGSRPTNQSRGWCTDHLLKGSNCSYHDPAPLTVTLFTNFLPIWTSLHYV